MNIKKICLLLFLLPALASSQAQTKSLLNVHQNAHKQLLANANKKMDKNVIQDYLKFEVEKREELQENKLSAETKEMLQDLISEAKSHLGKRYRSGGKGPSAFDCSGFSSYVFNQFGIKLGASSRDQFNQGDKIDINELREGDLVFFTGRNRKGGVGHVGIVVSADNEKGTFKFIHASTSQGIKIDSNTGYYEGRYLGAKRIISK